jgi:hypothetical protein
MDYHLVCVHPFGKYTKGQMITNEAEVAELLEDREHHFVRIPVPPAGAIAFAGVADEPAPVSDEPKKTVPKNKPE